MNIKVSANISEITNAETSNIQGPLVFLDNFAILNSKPNSSDFFLTDKRAKISKSCIIKNPSNILLATAVINNNTILRADLATLKIEVYCILCDNVIIHPPLSKNFDFTSITIGKFTIIGPNSIIKASVIGNCVRIGKNCVLEDNVVIGNNCIIEDDSVLPEDMNVPSGCVFGGKPAQYIRKTPFSIANDHIIEAISYYDSIHIG